MSDRPRCPADEPHSDHIWQRTCVDGVVRSWTNDPETGGATGSYTKTWCPKHHDFSDMLTEHDEPQGPTIVTTVFDGGASDVQIKGAQGLPPGEYKAHNVVRVAKRRGAQLDREQHADAREVIDHRHFGDPVPGIEVVPIEYTELPIVLTNAQGRRLAQVLLAHDEEDGTVQLNVVDQGTDGARWLQVESPYGEYTYTIDPAGRVTSD